MISPEKAFKTTDCLHSQVRAVLPDASALVDRLPSLGSYGAAVKSAWNSGVGATTGAIVAVPSKFMNLESFSVFNLVFRML